GGEERVSDGPGATLEAEFLDTCGSTEYGVVADKGPAAGILGVYFDGALAAAVDLYAPKVEPRQVVSVSKPVSCGPDGSLQVVNLSKAASSRHWVTFDGVVQRTDDQTENPH